MSPHAGLYREETYCSRGVRQLWLFSDERSVPFVVYFSSLGTLPSIGLNVHKALAGTAYPSDSARRRTCYQGKIRNITSHDGACSDECPPPDGVASDDHGARAKRRPRAHDDAAGDPVFRPLHFPADIHRTRIDVVGKHCSRTDENLVLKPGGLVDESVILKLHIVTDDDPGTDVGSPADDAPAAQASVLSYLSQMPDRSS
jgi:hypothetical protein